MQRHNSYIEQNKTKIYYSKYGKGNKVLICFHGYGQSKEYFHKLEEVLKNEYTIYSFDLFFHGKSFWYDHTKPITREYWAVLFADFLEENKIGKFSLLGYSMGGKFAFATLEGYYNWVEKLILIAPDGIKTNFWYRLATSSKLMRRIFKSMVENPGLYKNLVFVLHSFNLVDKGILRFADTQMQTQEQRQRVYFSWVNFRKLNFKMNKISTLINSNNIHTEFFLGEYDKMITIKDIRRLQHKLKDEKTIILKSGHTTLVDAVAKYYENKAE